MLATVIVYLPALHGGFIFDDDIFLEKSPLILRADGLYRFWFTAAAPDYFPLTSTTLWLEWRLWGGHPFGFHLVNVLLHAASAVILWRVLARLGLRGAAWVAAALFAIHPVNVESVAWITERKNTLAMFLYAWTLLWYLKFEDTGRRRWYGLALAAFALALLSKAAVAPLPLVLLGIAWWRRGRIEWTDFRRTIPFLAIALALSLTTIWFQYHKAIGDVVVREDGLGSRLAVAGCAVWFYLSKALLPLNLAFIYPRWQIPMSGVPAFLPGLLVLVALGLGWQLRHRWGREVLFGLSYYVLLLLPVLGPLKIYFMLYSFVADHWQYFSIISICALVAAGLDTILERLRQPLLRSVVVVALLGSLGVLTWRQAGIYRDAETLWTDTLLKNPACWVAHYNLGVIYDARGDESQAMQQYEQALRLKPDYPMAHINLGIDLVDQGKLDEAIQHYHLALQFKPGYADTHVNLGLALTRQGKLTEAVQQFEEAIRLKPDIAPIHVNLAIALFKQGKLPEAIQSSARALELDPNYAEAHMMLGMALAGQGRTGEAVQHFQQGLTLATSQDKPALIAAIQAQLKACQPAAPATP